MPRPLLTSDPQAVMIIGLMCRIQLRILLIPVSLATAPACVRIRAARATVDTTRLRIALGAPRHGPRAHAADLVNSFIATFHRFNA
jgi:hypothetical protein